MARAWREAVDPALDDARTAHQSAVHAACEILARTLGPFATAPASDDALDWACALLAEPDHTSPWHDSTGT